uniref:Uncharacterized protein n=1 Tax=Phaeomonas parva TaxID=124430 RepID=A0A7S1TSU9_9STRA
MQALGHGLRRQDVARLRHEVADCLRFAIDRLANLIAPAREGDYHAWARQVGSRLDLWSSGAESAATGDWKELVFCLPAVLSRLFHTITLTKADSLQAQVDALRPVLGMHGANYERSKFLSRLAQGLGAADPEHASFPPADVLRALPRTHRLLSMLLQTMGKAANTTAVHLYKSDEWKALYDKPVDAANALTGEAAGSIISTLKAGGAKLRFASGAVFSHIILHLLQAPVRLDAGPDLVLPEFLVLDASRFAKARDVLDRACLVVAMATLTQQVAARNRRVFGLAQMQALIERLNILLRDGTSGGAGQNVTLPALVDECVRAAEGSAPGTELPKEEVAALRVLIPNAASADHAIFKIVHKRVLGAWVHFLPFTHPDFLGRSEGAIPSSLDVASRDEGERAIARVSPGFNQTELGKELIAVGDALGKVMRHSIVVQGELVTALLQHLVRI